ncbi:NAD-dependent DNA ligase LigA [Halobacteriovorax sp. HLS]|uniref:NAD-dependent DNA ligase LigA n=1 Tax=Halobacteriovorax sp. HLS TaxID=2234000 RepID=UPI000FD891C3|nr:NAD-dependent DNA ligase LigA [Halobacteriovorax sp. HLS]
MNRVEELEALIEKHKILYYQGKAEIEDHVYDSLEDELRELKPNSSILQAVGSVTTGNAKVKHDHKMLSLNKTYKYDDLVAWSENRTIISMYKIDGMSCSLIYEKGQLVMAKTRGDGTFGENITAKAQWLSSIPKAIDLKERIEVRGEIYCEEASFFHLSDEMVSLGLDKPTSQRNIVAGIISRKDHVELSRHLSFTAFESIYENNINTEHEKMLALKKLGFNILDYVVHKSESTIKETIEDAKVFMAEGDYLIDGIVFSFDDLKWHREMGETAHHPRYKMAFKFQGESKETKINEIAWGVSRNGILTPVANVEPVELSGATISRVTLHNYGLVRQYELKKGDTIEIIRSGEVIPKFLSVVTSAENQFQVPENCPSCDESVTVEDIRLVCKNETCPAIIKESILNFIQKIGIDDLSSKRLDELINSKLITKISDLYTINEEQLMSLDKVQQKLADKLISSINKSKNVELVNFLAALGISGGAYNKCEKVIFAGYNTLEKIKSLTVEKLEQIDGFANKSATEFITSLNSKLDLIEQLEEVGFVFEEVERKQTEISNKKICITGSLSEKRSVIEASIRDGGGVVVSSVSKNTDFLLTNDKTTNSSKLKKALELNLTIINEEELKKILN